MEQQLKLLEEMIISAAVLAAIFATILHWLS